MSASADSEAGELRLYQQRASEAERDWRIWPEECLASERKFGHSAARLFPLIGVSGGVMTPHGQGTLFNARSDGCQVVLTRRQEDGPTPERGEIQAASGASCGSH